MGTNQKLELPSMVEFRSFMSFGSASLSTDADRCRNAEAIPVKDRIRQPITNYHEVHRTQWVLPLLCTSLVRCGRRFPGMKNPPVLQRAGPLPLREIDLSASSQSCSLIIRDHRDLRASFSLRHIPSKETGEDTVSHCLVAGDRNCRASIDTNH
jgi:hypothetical protein